MMKTERQFPMAQSNPIIAYIPINVKNDVNQFTSFFPQSQPSIRMMMGRFGGTRVYLLLRRILRSA